MPRKTIRIKVNIHKPDALLRMMKKMSAKNTEMGAKSPMKDKTIVDFTDYNKKLEQAIKLRNEAELLRAQSETKMQQARLLIGIEKSQNVNTSGTLLNMLQHAKQYLLVLYKGHEEMLGEWGFDVVVGQAKSYQKKAK